MLLAALLRLTGPNKAKYKTNWTSKKPYNLSHYWFQAPKTKTKSDTPFCRQQRFVNSQSETKQNRIWLAQKYFSRAASYTYLFCSLEGFGIVFYVKRQTGNAAGCSSCNKSMTFLIFLLRSLIKENKFHWLLTNRKFQPFAVCGRRDAKAPSTQFLIRNVFSASSKIFKYSNRICIRIRSSIQDSSMRIVNRACAIRRASCRQEKLR